MKRILVIDDAPDILAVVQETIETRGWRPLTAATGEEGLALIRSENPDLVLCDVLLPGINGYEVLKQVRLQPSTATLPFVFLSGVADRSHIRLGMELGADDYVEKPFTAQELIRAIEARFQKQDELFSRAEKRFHELHQNLTLALPHELVTPLNTIVGFSALLTEPNLSAAEVQESARHIQEAADRLQRLVENFLFFAHLELLSADPARLRALRTDACDQTRDRIAQTARKIAREHKRETDLQLTTTNDSAPISCTHLDRLLRELLDNACKFSSPGAPIIVTASITPAHFELTVKDHGRGMTSEQIRQIAPHMQFERKMYEQQGAGLGLAIARRLAEMHGGSLDLQSVPNQFTEIRLRLPRPASAP